MSSSDRWVLRDLRRWIKKGCPAEEGLVIKYLDCSHSRLVILPPEIGMLINLQNLIYIF